MTKISLLIFLFLLPCISIGQITDDNLLGGWQFSQKQLDQGIFSDHSDNHPVITSGNVNFSETPQGNFLKLDGKTTTLLLTDQISEAVLPTESFSAEAWVQVMMPLSWGGILSAFQHNGDFQRGWVLGFRGEQFSFAVKSTGVGENGTLTYLSDPELFELGKWYHVVGTYDGEIQQLYVNGILVNQSKTQSGSIDYPENLWYEIGAYHDDNEYFRLNGKLAEVNVYTKALTKSEIESRYQKLSKLTEIESEFDWGDGFIISPYLQMATNNSISVLWETPKPATTVLELAERELPFTRTIRLDGNRELHKLNIDDLKPSTNYFYKVTSNFENGTRVETDILTFKTASVPDEAIRFAFFADTQNNPGVWGELAALIWAERPHFGIIAGDMVGTGSNRFEWIFEFFKPGKNLFERLPIYMALGNHEGDADNFYRYTNYPEPHYYYSFRYGNAEFFVLDSNRNMESGSEQFQWLEKELMKSEATWKFVIHHHPPYTSEESDYGNSWTEPSLHGDPKSKPLIPLFEKYKVDFVLSGHLHTYERTWPLKKEKIDLKNGVRYLIAGGGGGSLEGFTPIPVWFSNKIHLKHHYTMFHIFENHIEFRAIDIDGNTFDSFSYSK